MFNFVFLLISLLPLLGLIMMEGGAYGPDIYDYGHPNGASLAYAAHLTVMLTAYVVVFGVARLAVLRRPRASAGRAPAPAVYATEAFRRLAWRALTLNLFLLAFVFFVSGASNVVLGTMDKGQFRTQARYGYVAFLARDFLSPMLSALVAYVYLRCARGRREMLLLGANLVVTALSGAIWGYRAAVLMMLIPAAMILIRRMTLARGLGLVAGGLAVVVLASVYYEGYTLRVALNGAMTRASVGTANSAWRVWEVEMTAPAVIPPYAPTLASVLGSRIRVYFGFDPNAPLDVSHPADYGTLATLIAKNFSRGVDATSNVTTGIFGEAVVALGAQGFVLMSLAAGILVGFVRTLFEFGQQNYRPLAAVMAANYFMASIFSWLNSGGLTVLFFVPFLLNYTITYCVASGLLRSAGVPTALRRRRVPRTGGRPKPAVFPQPALDQS